MNLKNKGIKGLILIIGTIVLAIGYIGTLVFAAKAGIENTYINLISTIIFVALYFGMFITAKNYRKGYFRENKNNIINLLYLTIPFIIGAIAYLLTQNVFVVFISFIVAQIMYTIYYKNHFPVPGYNKAYKLYRNNDNKNAEAILNKILEKHPESFETLSLLGSIHKSNLEYQKAIECFKKSSSIRPYNSRPLINQINCHISIDDFDKAIEVSEKSIEIDPENWNLYYSIALSYFLKEDYEKASNYFIKASRLNVHPLQLFLVHYGIAESLSKINKIEKASCEYKICKNQAYKSALNYWDKQLELTKNNMNKASYFIKEAVEFVKKEKAKNKMAK